MISRNAIKNIFKNTWADISSATKTLKDKGADIYNHSYDKAKDIYNYSYDKTKDFYAGGRVQRAKDTLRTAEENLSKHRQMSSASDEPLGVVVDRDSLLLKSVEKAQRDLFAEKVKRGAGFVLPSTIGAGYLAGEAVNLGNPKPSMKKESSNRFELSPESGVAIHSSEKRDGVPRTLAGVGAAGLGASAYGAGKLNRFGQSILGSTLVNDDTLRLADSLGDIKNLSSSRDFLAQYADKGHRLVNSPTKINLPGIKASNGYEAVMALRTSPVYSKALIRMGLAKDVDADSLSHYEAFRNGKDSAIRQMFDETMGGSMGSARQQFLNDYKTARWNAIHDAAKKGVILNRDSIKGEILKKMVGGQSISDRHILSEMKGIVDRTEGALSRHDGYDDYFNNTYRAIGENNSQWLGELDHQKESMFDSSFRNGRVNSYNDVADELLTGGHGPKSSFIRKPHNQLSRNSTGIKAVGLAGTPKPLSRESLNVADGIVTDYASNMLRRSFAKAPDSYASYGKAIRGLRAVGESLASGGKWRHSAALGAAGLGGYALLGNLPRKAYESARNAGTRRRLEDQGINTYRYYT